jgi:hypothetical protein
MSNGTNPTTTPGAPPVCPGDVAVSDCKTAMIFSEKTPSFTAANAHATAAAKKAADNPTNTALARAAASATANLHCDFKAVWAYVPPPPADQLSVLVFYHGNDNWVRVDGGGACIVPDWAQDGDAIVKKDPVTKNLLPAFDCAPTRYALAAAAEADKKPIVLVPEDADPVVHRITTDGNLADKTAFGSLVDDCLKHLSDVTLLKKTAACGGASYLAKKPALTEIKRLFICGHSGGGKPLAQTAVSNLASSGVTDLCLLDCTYGWGNVEYVDYCKTKKASLGNVAGQSRLLCFYLPAVRDQTAYVDMRKKQIAKENEKRAKKVPPLPPIVKTDEELNTEWGKQWKGSTKQHVEDSIIPGLKGAGFKFDTSLAPPPAGKTRGDAVQMATGNFTEIENACRTYPIVFLEISGVGHDSFPTRFIPVTLKTAKVV